jgi:coenzyme F420 hydrogenase subunit beta
MKTYKELKQEVWDTLKCAGCGACVACCPLNAIHYPEGSEVPVFDGLCSSCGICYAVCPHAMDEVILEKLNSKMPGENKSSSGKYINIYFARAKSLEIIKRAQSYGVATTTLKHLLDTKFVDACIVVSANEKMETKAMIARNEYDLRRSAKIKYIWAPVLTVLREAVYDRNIKSIAIVGTPCVVQALRRIEETKLVRYKEKIKFRLGLFCWEILSHELIPKMIHEELKLDIDPKRIFLFNIKHRNLIIELINGEEYEIPLEIVSKYARKGCQYCIDFTNELSDMSIGNAGAPSEYLTVITRTELGEKVMQEIIAQVKIITTNFDPKKFEMVEQISEKKRATRKLR